MGSRGNGLRMTEDVLVSVLYAVLIALGVVAFAFIVGFLVGIGQYGARLALQWMMGG